jgi:hypothetical protein
VVVSFTAGCNGGVSFHLKTGGKKLLSPNVSYCIAYCTNHRRC